MYDGILNVYKEPGFTSFDVVAKLRGILHQKKIGHTGTLDPQAEGVLVVCVGKATKLCDILPDHDKEYEATLLLGVTTDTEDMTGEVLKRSEVTVSNEVVQAVMQSFIGSYEQVPPMYSAIKVNGQKLYELAREGKVIERQPRPVRIYELEIKEIQLPRVVFGIKCSRGTYIRSLCRDIGERLGCGGCMEKLVRISACGFSVHNSLHLSEIETMVREERLEPQIHSIDSMYPQYPRIQIAPKWNKLVYNGNKFQKKHIGKITEGFQKEPAQPDCSAGQVSGEMNSAEKMGHEGTVEAPYILVYDSDGIFLGIYEYRLQTQEFVPYKMFL